MASKKSVATIITFIGYQDDHEQNQLRIKSHAAKARYRKARALAAFEHRRRKSTSRPQSAGTQLRYHLPPSVVPPDELKQIELVLAKASSWMKGKFDSTWRPSFQQDPVVYDFDNGVEIVRESLFLVADLIALGKTPSAFEVLNGLLDMMPDLLRHPHPELFFFLVELSAGVNLHRLPLVHAKVKQHTATLASIMLGESHPITTLLRCKFGPAGDQYVAELVFACILDTLKATFGPSAYQTVCQQFARSQFYSATGQRKLAQSLMSEVQEKWAHTYGPDSALACVAEYELCSVSDADRPDHGRRKINALFQMERAMGMHKNKFNGQAAVASDSGTVQCSSGSLALGRRLLDTKRYTMAFHVYARGLEVAANGYVAKNVSRNYRLADQVTDIVRVAMMPELQPTVGT